jgi:hypothetical protein
MRCSVCPVVTLCECWWDRSRVQKAATIAEVALSETAEVGLWKEAVTPEQDTSTLRTSSIEKLWCPLLQ